MNLSSPECRTYIRTSLQFLESNCPDLSKETDARSVNRKFADLNKKICEMKSKLNTVNIEESTKKSLKGFEVEWLNEVASNLLDNAVTQSEILSQNKDIDNYSFRVVKRVIKSVHKGYLGNTAKEILENRVYASNVDSLISDLDFPKPKNKSNIDQDDIFDFNFDFDDVTNSDSDSELAVSNDNEVKKEELDQYGIEILQVEIKDLSQKDEELIEKKLKNIARQLNSLIENNDVPREIVVNVINKIELLVKNVRHKDLRDSCNKEIQEIKDIFDVIGFDERFQNSQLIVVGNTSMMFKDWHQKSLLTSLKVITETLNNV